MRAVATLYRYAQQTGQALVPHRDHVAILHDVIAPLGPQHAPLPLLGVASSVDELAPPDYLGAHEAGLDVAVNAARGVPCRGPPREGPGPGLGAPVGGEKRDQAKQVVRGADETREPRLVDSELGPH